MKHYSQLSQEERYFFSILKARAVPIPRIARELNRAPSTLYRELKRNIRPTTGYYAAFIADSYSMHGEGVPAEDPNSLRNAGISLLNYSISSGALSKYPIT